MEGGRTAALVFLLAGAVQCQFSNPNAQLELFGHRLCNTEGEDGGGQRVGMCYNELECLASGGTIMGACPRKYGDALPPGICCVRKSSATSGRSSDSLSYLTNAEWPSYGSGSEMYQHTVQPRDGTCFIRFDLLTLELEVMSNNCVHDRMTIFGGKEASGSMCGDRSGEVTLIEVTPGEDIRLVISVQSKEWRWNIGITQISCADIEKQKELSMAEDRSCGVKNPSTQNRIGALGQTRKKKDPLGPSDIPGLVKKKARKVFRQLEKLPILSEFEKANLKIYKPSFTKQELNYETANFNALGRKASTMDWRQKGRILYGNETDPNEYPWQVSMWIDRSHFCGGTLISDEWIVTAAHCVDMHYRQHFKRITVSLGDHNVKVYNDAKSVFRKLKRIVRSPQYDANFINGDMALLQLAEKVEFSKTVGPACLPDADKTFDYEAGLITGWGYTETTKIIKPRPLTADVLREAEIYILPQELCLEYSPFPITDRMVCTFKGPLGVETTCQGDSGGPLVVNEGDNRHVLVGATSFGVASCEGPYPSMFTRITAHLGFIHAAMVPAPMEYMGVYKTPVDPSSFPDKGTSLFGFFD